MLASFVVCFSSWIVLELLGSLGVLGINAGIYIGMYHLNHLLTSFQVTFHKRDKMKYQNIAISLKLDGKKTSKLQWNQTHHLHNTKSSVFKFPRSWYRFLQELQ